MITKSPLDSKRNERRPLRTRLAPLAAGLAAALLISPAALAEKGGVVSTTFTLKDEPQTFPANVCGVDYTVNEVTNVVFHVTDFLATPNPMDHVEASETGSVTLVPDDPGLPTYSGRVHARFGGDTNPNEEGFTSVLQLNLTGPDGSTFRPREIFHYTIVDGLLVVQFDKFSCD